MGITQVDPREAERFEEGLDSDYHDATEDPPASEKPDQGQESCFSHRGYGSSSLRECLELLNHAKSKPLLPSTLGSAAQHTIAGFLRTLQAEQHLDHFLLQEQACFTSHLRNVESHL